MSSLIILVKYYLSEMTPWPVQYWPVNPLPRLSSWLIPSAIPVVSHELSAALIGAAHLEFIISHGKQQQVNMAWVPHSAHLMSSMW